MRKMKRSDVREWIPGEPLERVDWCIMIVFHKAVETVTRPVFRIRDHGSCPYWPQAPVVAGPRISVRPDHP